MRVAIDCSHHPVPGGVRTYLDNLVPALSRVGPDLELDLYYRTRRSPSVLPKYPHARSRVAHVPGSRRLWSWVERRFDWPPIELHCGEIDVVHGTHFTLPAARHARRVLTVHDVAYLKHPELYADRSLNEYGYRTLLQSSLSGADLVLAISHHTRNDLVVECGVDPDRVWVVPFGWDQRMVRRPEAIWRPEIEALGIDRPYVLYPAGSIDVRKNIERVFEGFAAAFPTDRPLLVVTGVASGRPEFAGTVRTLGLTDDVKVLRASYPAGLEALLCGAEWGIYLSLYEGFGLPLLEMMGCGLPAVVSDRAAIPEVVRDAALVIDPTDLEAVVDRFRVMNNDARIRSDLSERGLARAADPSFSWDRAALQTLAAYRGARDEYDRLPNPLRPVELVG